MVTYSELLYKVCVPMLLIDLHSSKGCTSNIVSFEDVVIDIVDYHNYDGFCITVDVVMVVEFSPQWGTGREQTKTVRAIDLFRIGGRWQGKVNKHPMHLDNDVQALLDKEAFKLLDKATS